MVKMVNCKSYAPSNKVLTKVLIRFEVYVKILLVRIMHTVPLCVCVCVYSVLVCVNPFEGTIAGKQGEFLWPS